MLEGDWGLFIKGTVAGSAVAAAVTVLLTNIGTVALKVSLAVSFLFRKVSVLWNAVVVRERKWQAARIVDQNLGSGSFIRVPIEMCGRALGGSPGRMRRELLPVVAVDCPEWFDDYYFACGMERLVARGRAVKARQYSDSSWPPDELSYLFRHVDRLEHGTAEAEVEQIETDSICLAYQGADLCPLERRFWLESYARTLAYNRSWQGGTWHKVAPVGPCERCWERKGREDGLRMLVGNLLRNELYCEAKALSLEDEASEESKAFVGAVVSYCQEAGISYERVDVALEVTRQAVALYECYVREEGAGGFDATVLAREMDDGRVLSE